MNDINTLVPDIYNLFSPEQEHIVNEDNLQTFLSNLGNTIRRRLKGEQRNGFFLRFSGLGKPDRQLWYDSREYEGEALSPKTYFKFLYGDILEETLLFLAKEAGHEVTDEQKEVDCLGVKGHIDAKIDGVVVDVKSASPFGFKKFKEGSLIEDDSFGYIQQISGYATVESPNESAAFLACDKVSGELALMGVSSSVIASHPPGPRIEHLREIIGGDIPPPRCFPDEADGKSGNRKLGTRCSYCSHKFRCWEGLRGFAYSTGPRYLTHVERVPDVYEFTSSVKA